jgi:hypothetical protein
MDVICDCDALGLARNIKVKLCFKAAETCLHVLN